MARASRRLNTKDLQAIDALVRTVFQPHLAPDRLALLGGALSGDNHLLQLCADVSRVCTICCSDHAAGSAGGSSTRSAMVIHAGPNRHSSSYRVCRAHSVAHALLVVTTIASVPHAEPRHTVSSAAVVVAGPPERRWQRLHEHSRRAVAVAGLVRTAFAAHLPPEALRGAGTSIAPPSFAEISQSASLRGSNHA